MWIVMQFRARLPVLMLTGLVLASPAWAQLGGSSGVPGAGNIASGGAGRGAVAPKPAEPSALPGNQSRTGAAPLTKPPSEMGPTEALFDAVNRGDSPAAREAVTRGADLDGRNVLSLTPLELAVDLGQNDIAFLLLSLRDADAPSRTGKGAVKTAAAPPAPVKQPTPVLPARAAPAERAAPQRAYPTDGGASVPNAGFLGFGGR
jgi:hypothetical protein